jgi:hypothetical protein
MRINNKYRSILICDIVENTVQTEQCLLLEWKTWIKQHVTNLFGIMPPNDDKSP